jgi:hydroxyacylglutathione hydrolase
MQSLQKGLSPAPAYFQHVKKMNVEGAPLLSSLKTTIWTPEKGPPLNELFLVDVRHPECFATSFLQGSLNIPISPTFCQWAGWMLPINQPIGLIVENTHVYFEIVDQLRLMGFDQEMWIIHLDDNHQISATMNSFPMMEVEELAKQSSPSIYIVDVRTLEEWRVGHLSHAHHIELNILENSLHQLPKDQSIALLCRSGHRASLAASLLRKHGFLSVINIRGGMQAWNQAGLPLESGNH